MTTPTHSESEIKSGELKVGLEIRYSTDMAFCIVTREGDRARAAAFRDWLISQVSFRP